MGFIQFARTLGLTAFVATVLWSGSATASDVLRASPGVLKHLLPITVTGTASKRVSPDQVTMQVTVSASGPDVGSVVEDLNAQKQELMRAAEAEDAELISADVSSLNVRDTGSRRRNKQDGDRNYQGRMQVGLILRFSGDPLELIAKVTDGRVDGISGTRFQFSGQGVDSEALRQAALEDARERAQKKAELLETKLGRLLNVNYRETPLRNLHGSSGRELTVRANATFARDETKQE